MPDGSNLIIGSVNTGTSTTSLQRSGGQPTIAFEVVNDEGGMAISARSRSYIAIQGLSEGEIGVLGLSRVSPAVQGEAVEHIGVWGTSSGAFGVQGDTTASDSAGVSGLSHADGVGVWGFTGGATWAGVEGYSTGGNGVRGVSVAPAAPWSVGVIGYSENGTGIYGQTDSPSNVAWGGAFVGGLMVWKGPKSAAVPHPDGSHRALYCVESPESWFEDFGRAKLVRGRARVKLDRNFAAIVRTNNYHVFLSPENETRGLYVSSRNRAGFEVREHMEGASSAKFSYRIVARRRDINPPRFAKVALPRLTGKELRGTPKAIDVSKLAKRGSASRRIKA